MFVYRYKRLLFLLSQSQRYTEVMKDKIGGEGEAAEFKRKKANERKSLKESNNANQMKGVKRKKSLTDKESAASMAKKFKADKVEKVQVARNFKGEDIPDEQPLLLTGKSYNIILLYCYNYSNTSIIMYVMMKIKKSLLV